MLKHAGFAVVVACAVVACEASPSEPRASSSRSAAAVPASVPTARPRPSHAKPLRRGSAAGIEYVETTTGGAPNEDRLPLVVAIHGLGDRPESFAGLFGGFPGKARVVLPRGLDAWGDGWSWFPLRGEVGEARFATALGAAADRVATSLREISRTRPTRGRIVVTGFSQGGMLSFALAARHPDLLAAAFPVSGTLPEALWPNGDAGAGLPVVAMHGDADTRVPIGPARLAVEALRKRGYRAELREFVGVEHTIAPQMRAGLHALVAERL